MYYEEFSILSPDDLAKKLSKLHTMRKHYLMFQQQHMVETIDIMIETCYNILDERRNKIFDDEILKTSGVIIDVKQSVDEINKKEEQDVSKPRTQRRRITII